MDITILTLPLIQILCLDGAMIFGDHSQSREG